MKCSLHIRVRRLYGLHTVQPARESGRDRRRKRTPSAVGLDRRPRTEKAEGLAIRLDENIDRLAFEAGAEAAIVDALRKRCLRNEVMVAFHRIWREIGEPGEVA